MASQLILTTTVDVGETRHAKYFNNEVFSDVTLFIGKESVKFFGHKAIIGAKSDVFERQFIGDWKDKDEVKLENVNEAAFKVILWFMYTDEIKVEATFLLDVLQLSHTYSVKGMWTSLCSEEMVILHRKTQLWKYLTFAVMISDFGFINRCLEFIDMDTEAYLSLEDFLSVEPKVIDAFIVRNTLCIEEVKLFQFIVKWAQEQEKKTGVKAAEVVKPFIPRIRFSRMTLEEFTQKVEPTNILSSLSVKAGKEGISSKNIMKVGLEFDSQPRRSINNWLVKAMKSKCSQGGSNTVMYCCSHGEYVCLTCALTCHYNCSMSNPSMGSCSCKLKKIMYHQE